MNFIILIATPLGKYLIRAKHLNIANSGLYKSTKIFINCAYIKVIGLGIGTLGLVTHFLGAFNIKNLGI